MALPKTLWQSIVDLVSTGQSVSDQFDVAFSNIDDAIDQIDLNTTAISSNDVDILALQKKHFKRSSNADTSSTTSSTYSQLNALTILAADLVVGAPYRLSLSMLFGYSTTTRSAYFRVSKDNGTTWIEVRKEVKNITDMIPETLLIDYNPVSGVDADIIIQYRTEADGDVLTVPHQHIFFERFD